MCRQMLVDYAYTHTHNIYKYTTKICDCMRPYGYVSLFSEQKKHGLFSKNFIGLW